MSLSTALTGLASWPYSLVLLGSVLVGLLYGLGAYRLHRSNQPQRLHWWNFGAFAAGLVLLLAALHPATDDLARHWFWIHMLQNEVLAVPVAILLMLGMPVWALWHALPQAARGFTLRWALRRGWPRQLWRAFSQWLFGPWAALAIYLVSFSIWHVPPIYDAALEHAPLYALELAMFLGTGLLLWGQMIPLRPGTPARLGSVASIIYIGIVGMHSSFLGSLYMFATGPYYPYYIAAHSGGNSTLLDQHLAGAAMDVPGTILFSIALFVFLWLWLSEDERAGQTAASPAGPAAKP
jgi:cytochrome c oxidase assembly factor CtaG